MALAKPVWNPAAHVMEESVLLEGPLESDYSLAIVNRRLAYAMLSLGQSIVLHQRDNTTSYFPQEEFLKAHPRLAERLVRDVGECRTAALHSRYIYPPFTDTMIGRLHVVHCYGWEESRYPSSYVRDINRDLDLITVMSHYVKKVMQQSGVTVPIVVVGLGADHIGSVASQPVALPSARDEFLFLHVSSCFPRKACDVLLTAFCREFSKKDRVRLLIKSFPNPHNEIRRMMEETFQAFPEHAPVSVVETPFSVAEMRFLYERADCLVSASRGEGFGLPVAEAMWLGRPVIATIHSGQADLCTPGNCWPVAFELKGAKSHLSHPLSYWAEPSPESIQEQMRSVFAARPAERDARSKAAQRHIRTSFTWNGVAARHLLACQSVERRKGPSTSGWRASEAAKRISVAFVSSWNTPCGIAEYTRLLVERLEKKIECHMFANRTEQTIGPDGDNVIRCWPLGSYSETPLSAYQPLLDALLASDVSVISIQFNFAFFPAHILEFLTGQLTGAGRRVIVTLHATDGPDFDRIARALRRIDLCLVHRKSDLEHLVADYQLDNAVLLDHGIVAPSVPAAPAIAELRRRSEFVVGSFGFCLPLKGLYELILAVALARKLNWRIRLKLLNALYPVRDSEAYAQTCVSLVKELDLGGCVEMCTEFLDETTIFRELATTDLIVLPYVASTESCSGAVRYPLASLKPVLCTDLAVFEDLAGIVHQVPAGNVMALAMKLVELSQDLKQLSRYSEAQAAHVQQYSWRTVAAQFQQLIEALQADVDQTAAMKASPPDAFDSVFSKAVPARHAL